MMAFLIMQSSFIIKKKITKIIIAKTVIKQKKTNKNIEILYNKQNTSLLYPKMYFFITIIDKELINF